MNESALTNARSGKVKDLGMSFLNHVLSALQNQNEKSALVLLIFLISQAALLS